MLDLNELFNSFNDEISLTSTYKDKITTGRDALRKKISKSFLDNARKKPKYCTQGSFAMNTAIMPEEEGEFDLDNGVYLQGYSVEQSEWPTTQTVHKWVKNAVVNHTSNDPVDKNTCVRVIYADKYHIDLPIYIMGENDDGDEIAYLAHKSKGWVESDPKAFTRWVQEYVNDKGQIVRRLIKYLKAWKEYKGIDIKGIAITILVCENLNITSDRDDISLLDTVTDILDFLEDNFTCYKPVTPKDEDLFANTSETAKNAILNGLRTLKRKLDKAINDKSNEREATDILKQVFGDRFPDGEDRDKDISEQTKTPVDIGNEDGHFA